MLQHGERLPCASCRRFSAGNSGRRKTHRRPRRGRKEVTMSTKEIESKARRLKILKDRQESLQAEIDQLESDLKAQLEAWDVDEVQAGPFRVVWKFVNSSRFDTKRFRDENGNLYNMYMIPNSYRKFSVV